MQEVKQVLVRLREPYVDGLNMLKGQTRKPKSLIVEEALALYFVKEYGLQIEQPKADG